MSSATSQVMDVETPAIDPMEMRQALGHFPTGVTIITTRDKDGAAVGMTASSFNSLSLTPPLVLWSIDKNTGCFAAFSECQHFAIHVLTEDQSELSNLFAKRGVDKFSGLNIENGIGDSPLLDEYCARFECEIENRFDGGDHVILVGRVLGMDNKDGQQPLVFHRGRYVKIT